MKTYLFEQSTNSYYLVTEDNIEPVQPPSGGETRDVYLFGSNLNIAAIPMPLKQEKQIIKALPFALEESLGSELDDTYIKYIQKHDGIAYSLILEKNIMQQMHDEILNHKVSYLPNILPITAASISVLILDKTACVRINNLYAYSIPLNLLEMSIDLELKNNPEKSSLTVYQIENHKEQNQLILAQLQSLNLTITDGDSLELCGSILATDKSHLNLLSGDYKRRTAKQSASTTKFKVPAYLLAACVLLAIISTNIETSKLNSQAEGVQAASVEFYKKLFPGERVRPKLIKRQFNDAIKQAGSGNGAGLGFTHLLAKTASETQSLKGITFESIKYNSKNKNLELSLACQSVSQLDTLKEKLSNKGLSVDIASANQSGNQVKGVIKVSSNG